VQFLGLISWIETRRLKEEKSPTEKEVTNRTSELNQSFRKTSIHPSPTHFNPEKMASLVLSLTAGIAHEIPESAEFCE